jgi:ribA/ribD-fused uncharacterized protein
MTLTPLRSTADLIAHVRQGRAVDYLFFWGHQPPRDGSIGKTCMSQWYEAAFSVEGTRYPTAEHYMMAEKARLFGDESARTRILAARTPAEAKKLGRTVRGFDEATWTAQRFDIVVRANVAKFSQNAALGSFLQATGDKVIVEASPVDRIWGIGLAATDEAAQRPDRWRGLNLLGFALMEVRSMLRGSSARAG